jgi:hypothetical protein
MYILLLVYGNNQQTRIKEVNHYMNTGYYRYITYKLEICIFI